ncbi:hypothetical protein L1987_49172 [Smallanthus sonchifolius]|uniref:Uncharacterized protein n=1 Tax=Smallanthus sonchifolius TaxID=185202 RepID=A0ACB9FUM1_9ASTR|nr:hypothetical protein L1987_49172 [Smallanthus sonchifolius]
MARLPEHLIPNGLMFYDKHRLFVADDLVTLTMRILPPEDESSLRSNQITDFSSDIWSLISLKNHNLSNNKFSVDFPTKNLNLSTISLEVSLIPLALLLVHKFLFSTEIGSIQLFHLGSQTATL